ncbi:MAG: DoxX family protein [Bdellovibrionales bacterium]|nr:DoxX family protein [Bdellovibrionales bacterium]
MRFGRDEADLIFRGLFCLIFVGLGAEHLFSDQLIQRLMPEWIPYPRMASIVCGVWLTVWGGLILIGYQVKLAAFALGVFLVIVTVLVHVPGVIMEPTLPEDVAWMWTILQRSNLAKNLCLLGVCFMLFYHDLGKYSVEHYLGRDSSKKS